MSPIEFAILGLYFLTLVVLAVFGFHRYIMVFLYYRHRDRRARPLPPPARLPRVTVQLPLYNEMYVVDRLVDSVCRIRYPKELLEIQILDDSVDETQEIAKAVPASAHVVKAFNTVFGHVLVQGGPLDVFFAGDDADAKSAVSEFLDSIGYDAYDAGSLADSWRFDVGTPAYGRPYTTDTSGAFPPPPDSGRQVTADVMREALAAATR